MAAKFFTGLEMTDPDPECVFGHGEAALGAKAVSLRPHSSPDHSRRVPVSLRRALRREAKPQVVSVSREGELMASSWFETVAVAQRRAEKRLPKSVYGALVAGSEKGSRPIRTICVASIELGFAPHVAGNANERSMATTVMGQIGLDAGADLTDRRPGRAPRRRTGRRPRRRHRGVAMGLSSFASKSVEEVCAACDQVLFQMYWSGDRDTMVQRLDRAKTPEPRESS